MRDRTPKMLTFPDLGLAGRGSSRLTQILRMSVELDNVPGKPKPVNTFLAPGTQPINLHAGILVKRLAGTTLLIVPATVHGLTAA